MFEPRVELWAGCGLDQLPRSRFFRATKDRREHALSSEALECEAGFAEGYAKGLIDGATVQARDEALQALVERIEAVAKLPTGSVELLLAEAAKRIADAIEVDLDVTSGRTGEIVARLAEAIEAETVIIAVYLHPADIAAVDGLALPFAVQSDESVPMGCARLRTDSGWLEDGPALRLRRFRAGLDRQAGL